MYVPDPVCCVCPGVRRLCEESSCCGKVGTTGFDFFDRHRRPIMLFMALLAVVSTALSVVPVVSTSTKRSVVMNSFWTQGKIHSENTMFFVGLKAVVVDDGDSVVSYEWDSSECSNVDSGNRGFCDKCKDACDATFKVVIVNLITSIPTIMTDLKRSTREGDMNCQKFMAILTGIVSTLTTLSSLSLFLDGCFRHLPDSTTAGNTVSYSLGPGFICLLIPQIIKPLDVIVNIMTPVACVDKDGDDIDFLLDNRLLADSEDSRETYL
mmetsp:Transcript_3947/g.6178  ORF Transcript_3947/g.6178 Transcript_3947/m.6178 type:complete len:266 (+) Transcript_3947:90-887(+)